MNVTKLETGVLGNENSVFIAFYTKAYHHYQTHEECRSWGDEAFYGKIGLLGITARWDASYGFVGGKVDNNETLLKAALREAKEEVGYDVDPSRLNILCSHHMIDGDFQQHTHLYLCEVSPDEIYEIQRKSINAEHARIENAGFNVVHMVKDSFVNLKKLPWAGTARQEIDILLNSEHIPKYVFEKNDK